MTIGRAIRIADANRPNAFDINLKTLWLGELDGQIAAEIMLMSEADQKQFAYTAETDLETELLVDFPYDGIYVKYLFAKIDEMNGEYDSYANDAEIFNNAYGEYSRWFSQTYDPIQEDVDSPQFIISAYSLAVKQGFSGSVDEWLASIKGEPGSKGDSVYIKYSENEPERDSDMIDIPSRWMGICVLRDGRPTPTRYTEYRWYDRGVNTSVPSFNGRTGAITFLASDIPVGSVGTSKIENEAITHAKMGEGAVEAGNIGDGAVESRHITNEAVTNEKLAAGSVNALNLATDAVTSGKIAGGAVTPAKLSLGAIPFKTSVTLDSTWAGSESPYAHAVSVSGYAITANSKVDIQPTEAAIAQLTDDGVSALYISNSNGTLTAYAVGQKPTDSLTLQITVEEVRG